MGTEAEALLKCVKDNVCSEHSRLRSKFYKPTATPLGGKTLEREADLKGLILSREFRSALAKCKMQKKGLSASLKAFRAAPGGSDSYQRSDLLLELSLPRGQGSASCPLHSAMNSIKRYIESTEEMLRTAITLASGEAKKKAKQLSKRFTVGVEGAGLEWGDSKYKKDHKCESSLLSVAMYYLPPDSHRDKSSKV